ncbi:MAG: hypothetical protein RMI94_06660, partial [Bryobacterales bacterium]|nr:hypothetical protein [Bryobacteraceae bacterium]MDW8130213.1 hypothetical protein [Bryobacterales bacterium]
MTIFGRNLGRRALAGAEATFTLGGCAVRICDAPARMFFASNRQLNVLVPWAAAGNNECDLVVRTLRLDGAGEAVSAPVRIKIEPAAIVLFEFRLSREDGVPVAPGLYLPVITDA